MIEISGAAKNKIKEILEKNPGKCLRVTLEGDGCAGPYFGLSLDEALANDVTAEVNGIDILISDEIKRYAEVTTINIFADPNGEELL